jgi:hypothetical protein
MVGQFPLAQLRRLTRALLCLINVRTMFFAHAIEDEWRPTGAARFSSPERVHD